MAEDVELYVYRKGELRDERFPDGWEDPDNLTSMSAHHRAFLLGNPLSKRDDDPVRAYALIGQRVVGHLALMMGEVRVHGEPVPVLWAFNLIISPASRGRGLATKLVRCWQDYHHTAIGNYVNDPSVGIYRKLKWDEFHMPGYQVIARSAKFIAGATRLRPLAAVTAPFADAILGWRRRSGLRTWRARLAGLQAEPSETMSAEFDAALARPTAPVATHRSAAWVNWLLHSGKQDSRRENRLYYAKDKHGTAVGYFILQWARVALLAGRFKDVLIGTIKDWGTFDPSRADRHTVTLLGIQELLTHRADVYILTLSDAGLDSELRAVGARPRSAMRVVLHASPESPLAADEFRREENWQYTAADSDGFFV